MMVAHCASITTKIRLGTAVVVLPLYNPARLMAEIATADALSNGRLMLGVGAGYQPYEFEPYKMRDGSLNPRQFQRAPPVGDNSNGHSHAVRAVAPDFWTAGIS
jgi:alkanesulfonate monooxygenase SsuD/methylene tetrahydromethanopterin reductase-like flavin-dependent oxidoreductase (luciferase family)